MYCITGVYSVQCTMYIYGWPANANNLDCAEWDGQARAYNLDCAEWDDQVSACNLDGAGMEEAGNHG